jgi:Alw26I/Eco31I/Esp3I family type II restriction endonuclease
MKLHTYGRGKFVAHPNYIKYMEMIVSHPNYKLMPNARSMSGKINWQVSSGKTTSFYQYYLERKDWWIKIADGLNLPGKDDEQDRFTIAARIIHPTGYRACRLCGEDFNVGYFYINANFAKKLGKDFPVIDVAKEQPIDDVLEQINQCQSIERVSKYFLELFPERKEYFKKHGFTKMAFEESRHVRSYRLSPGFMGNPPDRLDGFHDYHGSCRKINDPGRHDGNMRSYNHDRRSFEWWAEGNWALADALYNKAGPGKCCFPNCDKELAKVSPDHVGPIACGFKQSALFVPMCVTHNAAKNRRFSLQDVARLLKHERETGKSVASWQVRAHWDKYKQLVRSDSNTKSLSNSLRSLQDMYLRTLWMLHESGQTRLIATILKPEYAFLDFSFIGLDSAELTFMDVRETKNITNLRKSFAARTVRIAFESLEEYVSKGVGQRKMVRNDFENFSDQILRAIEESKIAHHPSNATWNNALDSKLSADQKEQAISSLFELHKVPVGNNDKNAFENLSSVFDMIGESVEIDFSRYDKDYQE